MKKINLTEICNFIKENYDKLPKSIIEKRELVIFATGDFSGEYGYGSSDLDSYGVDKEGKLYWAFASGCSCSCGAGTEEKTVKIIEIGNLRQDFVNGIKNALQLFEKDKGEFIASLNSYEYESW